MNIAQKTFRWLDLQQQKHKALGFPLAVVKKYSDDQASRHAALLAYFAFWSLFPALLLLTTFAQVLIRNNPDLRESVIESATTYFPIIGDQLQSSVNSIDGTGWVIVIGVVLLVYGARGVADSLRNSVLHVWQVSRYRRGKFPRNQLKNLAILCVMGAGLVLAPVVAGYVVAATQNIFGIALAIAMALAILYLMFLSVVRIILPNKIPVRDLRPAAILSTLGLAVLQLVGFLIVTRQLKHFDSLYGVFAIVLVLLFWLYLQAQIIFIALEVASVRALRLWPRAFDQSHMTEQDKRALQMYARRNQYARNYKVTLEPPK